MDGMLAASETYYAAHGEPLFSSHMLDLSEEPLEENIETCKGTYVYVGRAETYFAQSSAVLSPHVSSCLEFCC